MDVGFTGLLRNKGKGGGGHQKMEIDVARKAPQLAKQTFNQITDATRGARHYVAEFDGDSHQFEQRFVVLSIEKPRRVFSGLNNSWQPPPGPIHIVSQRDPIGSGGRANGRASCPTLAAAASPQRPFAAWMRHAGSL